jgi:hypothetical protein
MMPDRRLALAGPGWDVDTQRRTAANGQDSSRWLEHDFALVRPQTLDPKRDAFCPFSPPEHGSLLVA